MKRGFTVLEFVIIGMIVVILAAILLPAFARTDSGEGGRARCQDHLRSLTLAVTQYAQDSNDHYPGAFACSSIPGWAVMLQPYLRSSQVFKCPTVNEGAPQRDVREAGYTDYWANESLLGASTRSVESPVHTFAFGEGNDGSTVTDSRYALDSLEASWLAGDRSPLHRHARGSNYAFADGHVAWISADTIKSPFHIGKFSFNPREAGK